MSLVGQVRPAALLVGIFLLGPLVSAAPGQAQQQLRWGGYLEHQFSGSWQDGVWQYLDYDRLRADLSARAGRGVRMSAAVVWQLYRGETWVRMEDFLPSDLVSEADSTMVEVEDRHFLNHAYLTLRPGPFEVTAGKQYLTWGAGFFFNPTELFRPKDLIEPTYEREGLGAVTAKLPLADLSELLVAFVPDGGFDTSGKLFRARHHLAGFDLSALVAEIHETAPPSALRTPPGPLRRRITVGGDITGELFGLGIWAEGTWSDHADESWVETTVGGNYTLSDGTLLMLEGYYNGRGEWNKRYSEERWARVLSGHERTLGKGTIAAVVSRPVRQLWTAGVSTLLNPGDGSFVLIPSLAYAYAENVDLLLNGIVYVGAEGSAFSQDRQAAFVRARVYF